MSFLELPNDILFKVISFVPIEDRRSLGLSCRRLYDVVTDPSIWPIVNTNWHGPVLTDSDLVRLARVGTRGLIVNGILTPSTPKNTVANITDEGLSQVIPVVGSSLVYLDLCKMRELKAPTLALIPQYLHNLTHLNLKNCFGLTDDILAAICSNIPHLTFLDIANSYDRVTEGGYGVVARLTELEHLSLWGNHAVPQSAITSIVESCLKITHLDLRFCFYMSDDLVGLIARSLPAITYLDLGYEMDVGPAAIANLMHLESLKYLCIRECYLIKPEDLGTFTTTHPDCHVEDGF